MIEIEIDKLTNSIENRISGDVFNTEVLQVNEKDLKGVTKKKGWKFDWKKQLSDGEVYKLVIAESKYERQINYEKTGIRYLYKNCLNLQKIYRLIWENVDIFFYVMLVQKS